MKSAAVATVLFAAAAVAQPHGHGALHEKRLAQTVTDEVTVTVTEEISGTTTVWIGGNPDAPATTTAAAAVVSSQPAIKPVPQKAIKLNKSSVPETKPTTTAAAAVVNNYVKPTTLAKAVVATSKAQAPAAAATSKAAVAYKAPSVKAVSSKSSATGNQVSGVYATQSDWEKASHVGKMTWYDPSVGKGSCGYLKSGSDHIVALWGSYMSDVPNPNDNPLCLKWITVEYNGKSLDVQVTDACPTCDNSNQIDTTQAVLSELGCDGMCEGVSWSFKDL